MIRAGKSFRSWGFFRSYGLLKAHCRRSSIQWAERERERFRRSYIIFFLSKHLLFVLNNTHSVCFEQCLRDRKLFWGKRKSWKKPLEAAYYYCKFFSGGGGGGGYSLLMYSSMRLAASGQVPDQQATVTVERRSLNSELWHACAGPLVGLPAVGSRVVYFPQGHTEQVAASTQKEADAHIPNYPNLPSRLICLLDNVTLHADLETDEVYAQMTLIPTSNSQESHFSGSELAPPSKQPTDYFCKTLTASDTSTHGGFSIPRRAAEKVFPTLDYTQQPPAQELVARDLHDQEWHFRHIYRGQPRRHLLTTGWSVFVSAKRLQAGDSVLFIRDDKGQLLLGIRRATRQQTIMPSSVLSSDSMHIGVLAAANHAAATNSRFTIFYNPRQSPSEFVIPLAKYDNAVINSPATVGMRFRMVFETEESTIRRYMGTITGIGDIDPMRWPNSYWRSLKVGWDESTAGEKQRQVSLWEIEPLTAPFLLCPPIVLRSKRPRGFQEEEDLELLMKKSQLWSDSNDALSNLNFQCLAMDSPWMCVSQQRPGLTLPSPQNENYRALAAAALQEIRSRDSKQLLAQAPMQMWQQQQQPQAQQQQQLKQGMHQMGGVPGPLLQLSGSQPQSPMDLGVSSHPVSRYGEADLDMSSSPSISPSFALQSMLGRLSTSGPLCPGDNMGQYSSILRSNQNALQGSNFVTRDPQVSSPWVSTLQSPTQSDMVVTSRLGRMDNSASSGVPGAFNEAGMHRGLAGLPAAFGYRDIGHDHPDQQHHGDRSHLLFGVSIDQPLVGSTVTASLESRSFGKCKDPQNGFSGSTMIPAPFCALDAPELSGLHSGIPGSATLDEDVLNFQCNSTWGQATPPSMRTFTKVHKLGMPGRSLDVRKFHDYPELKSELARMFKLEGQLEDPRKGWQLVFVDDENDTLLVGDDPWEEFVTCVRSIKILSPSEVTQISQEQLEILNTGVPVQQRPASSNSEDACTQTSPSNLASGGSLDH